MNISVGTYITAGLWLGILFLFTQTWRLRRGRVTIGPGAIGTMDHILNEDRRNAVEIIIEEKTGYHDPEDADGNVPEFEDPRVPRGTQPGGRGRKP